jgi:hypothetical protein
MEGSDHGIFYGNIQTFVWRERKKQQKASASGQCSKKDFRPKIWPLHLTNKKQEY